MEKRNFVNLNVNPCKMCMPMGAALAIKGFENSMMLLHGSQGCSTYIRRHMSGHFNEPIDIASSSLNEKGTVYGGEKNLKNALDNIIKIYNPSFIGVATTCLAETIGEDIGRFIREYSDEKNLKDTAIIPLATPGYGGSEFEGYFMAIKTIIENIVISSAKGEYVNIIPSGMSPGDIRNIKRILDIYNLKYILLPDISRTLDAPYTKDFNKIPQGGTTIADIKKMSGARATIEFSITIDDSLSPGKYLEDKYGVALYKLPIPVGIRNTDKFIRVLNELTGLTTPDEIADERGRLLDAMIDSHKFNGEINAAIYEEPELCFALGDFCKENGIKLKLLCTGTKNNYFMHQARENFREDTIFIDEIDFETIEDLAKKYEINMAIGNSDGKVLTEKLNIQVVRVGFPINDRIGGQRILVTGYNGTLELLDRVTNTLIASKYDNYRKRIYDHHFNKDKAQDNNYETYESNEPIENNVSNASIASIELNEPNAPNEKSEVNAKTLSHPCYSGNCNNARMHLPVAPKCNIQCKYCNRKYDCINESRPGVTSEVLSPIEALEKYKKVKEKLKNLTVVGIAGPGDALADFANTKETISLIREYDPEITFCISTNGLMLPYYAQDLIDLGINHLTVTVNSVDTKIGAKIYKYINFFGKKFESTTGAELLQRNQLAGIKIFSSLGGIIKVNIVMIHSINNKHIEEIVKKVKEHGAYMTNIMPLIPAAGSEFADMPLTNGKQLTKTRNKCDGILKQMYHCQQCRADAIGTLDNDISHEFRSCFKEVVKKDHLENKHDLETNSDIGTDHDIETEHDLETKHDIKEKPDVEYRFAVATDSGIYIDRHFGQVDEFHIYKYTDEEIEFVEKRKIPKYCNGNDICDDEDSKINSILETINDCDFVMALRIGYAPQKTLEGDGKIVIQSCMSIEDAIKKEIENVKNNKQIVNWRG